MVVPFSRYGTTKVKSSFKRVVQLDFVCIGSFTTLRQECAFQVNVCSRFILNLQLNPIIGQTLIKTVEETSFYAPLRESIGQSNY